MEPFCVRHDLIPGTSKLYLDFLYHFDRVCRFYPDHFSDPAALSRSAAAIRYPDDRRKQLVAALQLQGNDPTALSELAKPGTVAVVTGQQVGLFSGPAYTVFKALTAVRIAEYLKSQGTPAVPIFWLATEDHDLAEVDHAWVFNENACPSRLDVTRSVVGGGPVGELKFTEIPINELRESLGNLPFAGDVIERIQASYQPGATFGSAFRLFLQDLLKDFGLLFIDPLAPEIRKITAPFLADVVGRVPDLLASLKERNRELLYAGYHAQVHVDDDTSLLFLLSEGKRVSIRFKDGQFATKDGMLAAWELEKLGECLSPNALLRPVMEDYLLPTVTYVGGPAETAYMAQSQVLYQELLGRMPLIFPRNSFTLLDVRATKLMNRYSMSLPDLLDHKERVKATIASRLVPELLSDRFTGLQSSIAANLREMQAHLSEFDPTLESAVKKSTAKILYQVRRLAEKTARETLRRDERASREAEYLINLAYPQRHVQERLYSIVPFLAKHGMDLPHRLFDMTQLACPDHMVRTL